MKRRIAWALLSSSLLSGCPAEPASPDDAGAADDARVDAPLDASRDAGSCAVAEDCDDGLYCTGVERCVDGRCATEPVTCDDGIACTTDACSEERRRCESLAPDADGDGARDARCVDERGAPLGSDCDDADPARFPGNPEICDMPGHDEDCDTSTRGGVDDDGDGYESSTCCGRDAAGVMGCGPDCDDAVDTVHPTAPEVCNGHDEDCDGRVDDIIDGTVVCEAGMRRACTTSCGLAGTQPCNDSCLGWATCVADEVCNGCDDDDDGADDDGFECIRGASATCVTACGTAGVHLCDTTCAFDTCTAPEACNYCDDDGDGSIGEERPLASVTSTDRVTACGDLFGPGVSCEPEPWERGQELWAGLLDGTSADQAGAMWLDRSWTMGWGPIELDVTMELRAVSPGADVEMPLGGWAVVVGRGGTLGVGTPQANGVPTTIDGVAARWFWSQFDSCYAPSVPPARDDSVRGFALSGGGAVALAGVGTAADSTCFSGDLIAGGSTTFDGPASGTIEQRMQIRYTPDDPSTSAIDEEELAITAISGASITRTYVPTDSLPVGSGPLRIGITAGTYTRRDFSGAPGMSFGVPVRARVKVFRQEDHCCGPSTFEYPTTIVRRSICP